MLTANARRQDARSGHVARAALTGRIFDGDGQPMSPTFSHGRRGQVYRYYVSTTLQKGRKAVADDPLVRRVSANAIETIASAILRRLLPSTEPDTLGLLTRLEVHGRSLALLVPVGKLEVIRSRLASDERAEPDPLDPASARIVVPLAMRVPGGRIRISGTTPSPVRRDRVLIKALRQAHAMVDQDKTHQPRLEAAPDSAYLRKLVRLSFLAPDSRLRSSLVVNPMV